MSFPDSSAVKNRPVVQETQVQSLGWDDPLEEEMTTHSNNLAWEIPWTEDPGELQSMGSQRVQCDREAEQHFTDIYMYTQHIHIYITLNMLMHIAHNQRHMCVLHINTS